MSNDVNFNNKYLKYVNKISFAINSILYGGKKNMKTFLQFFYFDHNVNSMDEDKKLLERKKLYDEIQKEIDDIETKNCDIVFMQLHEESDEYFKSLIKKFKKNNDLIENAKRTQHDIYCFYVSVKPRLLNNNDVTKSFIKSMFYYKNEFPKIIFDNLVKNVEKIKILVSILNTIFGDDLILTKDIKYEVVNKIKNGKTGVIENLRGIYDVISSNKIQVYDYYLYFLLCTIKNGISTEKLISELTNDAINREKIIERINTEKVANITFSNIQKYDKQITTEQIKTKTDNLKITFLNNTIITNKQIKDVQIMLLNKFFVTIRNYVFDESSPYVNSMMSILILTSLWTIITCDLLQQSYTHYDFFGKLVRSLDLKQEKYYIDQIIMKIKDEFFKDERIYTIRDGEVLLSIHNDIITYEREKKLEDDARAVKTKAVSGFFHI